MLPYAPQYGPYFHVQLLTRRALKHCKMIQKRKSRGVLHIPLEASLPPKQPEVGPVQVINFAWFWGYWVIGDRRIPIVKSRQRPLDEELLNNSRIIMPIRFALYLRGILWPWQYDFVERRELVSRAEELKQQYGQSLVVQALFEDIFSILFALERRVLYDPACLELLHHREWTSPYQERHVKRQGKLYMFEKALRRYNKRIQTGTFVSRIGYAISEGGEPRDWDEVMIDYEEYGGENYDHDGFEVEEEEEEEPLGRRHSW
ncbi:uncharacterized protein GGS22DRAFT_156073 [Annulohypoxylon maeteangense]|uniref:uncharacterized protein n=1 Tax=Annulohypoxylon maeteangense TaxID=1927788 RepID=UPI002007FE81|nr:uncharacterized protein GGS22DRAFT_156073 [Annulohypoxylon maeteangense]KAI0888514.1 hypothetical protein GGS22DRAFT_156073 [Annulohypoxylon maeteangense]